MNEHHLTHYRQARVSGTPRSEVIGKRRLPKVLG